MSDYPNGNPPGQNNLHAGVEPYVKPENDPSAGAQKSDDQRAKEDGVEVREETDPQVQQELAEASKNTVQPASVEDNKKMEEEQEEAEQPQPQPKPAPQSEPTRSTTKK